MMTLRSQHLLFALGCCLGWQLWCICNQVIVIGLCVLLLLLLFNMAHLNHDDSESQVSRVRMSHPKAALTGHFRRVGASNELNQELESPRTPIRPAITDRRDLQQHAYNIPTQESCGARRALKPYDISLPSQESCCGTHSETHTNEVFAQVDMSTSSSSCYASESAYSFLLRTSPSGRQMAHRPRPTYISEREVILNWARGIGKTTSQTNSSVPPALYSPALPLTARRLAHHLSTPEGGWYSSQARIDASSSSSSSDPIASSHKTELCRFLLPAKRSEISHDSTATSYAPTPRKAKVRKREPEHASCRIRTDHKGPIDNAEGAGSDLLAHATPSSASHQLSGRPMNRHSNVDHRVHGSPDMRLRSPRAHGQAKTYSSYEGYDDSNEEAEKAKQMLAELRDLRQSVQVVLESESVLPKQLDPAFTDDTLSTKPDPQPQVEAAASSDHVDAEESEDTIRLIQLRRKVAATHAAADSRILEMAAKLNA